MTRDEVEQCTILRCVVGSTVHGINVMDHLEDTDEMGICIEPLEEFVTLNAPFEQFIYRTAVEREGRENVPSRAGDLDLVIYSLRKWLQKTMTGNPTMMLPLFAPVKEAISLGYQLRELAPDIVSRRCGHAFLGYMQAQRERLMGVRGQMRNNRSELVEKYGFDTKYAMHMLRLGFQGVEILTEGKLSLPMSEDIRTWLLDVRRGQVPLGDCLRKASELEKEVQSLLHTSILPTEPNYAKVNKWMQYVYLQKWQSARALVDRGIDERISIHA